MKRPDLCIEAMRSVAKYYPNGKLAILGYGPMEKKLRNMIESYGLSEQISLVNQDTLFFDAHPRDKKVYFMQKAWAFLLPSVKEGWGMVITEAGACGTPSIVTSVTGLENSVIDGETGIVISANPSAQELAKAMIRMIENKTEREKLCQGALQYAKQFTWNRSYQTLLPFL